MRLLTLLLTSGAAAGAYAAARRLMADESLVERLPAPAQPAVTRLRSTLLDVRAAVEEGVREGRAEREAAERALTREYHDRSHR